jgi:hypothetical protein
VSEIFLIFRELTGFVVFFVVGVCVPKVIPHFCSCFLMVQKHTPMYYLRLTCTETYAKA